MPEHSVELAPPHRVSTTLSHSPEVSCTPPYVLTPGILLRSAGSPAQSPRSNCSLLPELVVCSLSLHSVRTGMRIRPLGPYRQSRSRPRPYLRHCHYMPRLAVVNCFALPSQISRTKADHASQALRTLQAVPAPAGPPFQPTNQVGRSSPWSAVACGAPVAPVGPLDNPVPWPQIVDRTKRLRGKALGKTIKPALWLSHGP